MNRRLLKIAVGVVATAFCFAASLSTALPATASLDSEGELSYSVDGKTYSTNPPPIFADGIQLVPGDEIVESLWLRNDRDRGIEVNVQPLQPAESMQIYFETAKASKFTLGPSETTKVELKLGMRWSAANDSADQEEPSLEVQIDAVELAETEPSKTPDDQSEPPKSTTPDSQGPELEEKIPNTGFNGATLLLAGALAVLGGIVMAASRGAKQRSMKRTGSKHE